MRAGVVAKKGAVLQEGRESIGAVGGFEFIKGENPTMLAVKAADKAVRLLDAELPPGGELPVIMDNRLTGVFMHEALGHAAERTPSDNLKDLLWGIKSTITSGGDLKEFLNQKSKGFAQEYRRKLEEFTRTLSIYLEMYITVIIVGTIFVLVLTTIMSLVGGFTSQLQTIQMLMIIIGIPFITFIYVIMLKSVSPTEV